MGVREAVPLPPASDMRSRTALLVCLTALVALLPATPGSAAGDFTFYGSGFGHGIGMSQWGAYGLALQGWSHDQILTHYYTGTTVAQDTNEPASIRVGLTQGRSAIHVEARGGKVDVLIGGTRGQSVGTISGRETWTFSGQGGKYRITD